MAPRSAPALSRTVVAALCVCGVAVATDAPRQLAAPLAPDAVVTRVAFGSCSKHTRPQPLWAHIAARSPSVFAWLGDIVYADNAVFLKWRLPAAPGVVAAAFAAQAARPAYAAFAARVPVVGVYDDHDYGTNDGDRSAPAGAKAEARTALLDFLGEPAASPRRALPGGGVWARHAWGPPGRRVALLLLDVRSHREPYGGPGGDMLGAAQWAWLRAALLAEPRADVTLIASGIQVLSAGDPGVNENWGRHPSSKARLLALLAAANVSGAVLLSGDVHFGELAGVAFPPLGYGGGGGGGAQPPRALLELTSSGMTHAWEGPLKRWLIDLCIARATRLGDWHSGRNWGEVDIAWGSGGGGSGGAGGGGTPTRVTLRVMGVRRTGAAAGRGGGGALARVAAWAARALARVAWAPAGGGDGGGRHGQHGGGVANDDPSEGAGGVEPFVAIEHTVELSALAAAPAGGLAAAAVAACATADAMPREPIPACAAVLAALSPTPGAADAARNALGHAAIVALLGGAGLFALFALPLAALAPVYPTAASLAALAAGRVPAWAGAWAPPPARVRAAVAAAAVAVLGAMWAFATTMH